MSKYAGTCGWILARAPARRKSDTFDQTMGDFAELYLNSLKQNCELFLDAIEPGKITAEKDVWIYFFNHEDRPAS